MSKDSKTGHIVQSLAINVVIAITKGAAAGFTGSGAMLAEAIHTGADCANQILLLVGVRQASKPPSPSHPLGYGRALYFWSFMVALLLFMGGGVFSVREGIHKLLEPEPVSHIWWAVGILGVSILLEGYALLSNVREMNVRRGEVPFVKYLSDTKDSDLIVVFGENGAAVIGLFLSLAALLTAHFTGNVAFDAIGSIAIGVVLIGVAIFLAREVTSLLVGESADPRIALSARALAKDTKHVDRVLHLITVQQGPGEVVVSIKLAFKSGTHIDDVCIAINDYELRLRAAQPEVKWCFVEPDIPRETEKIAAG